MTNRANRLTCEQISRYRHDGYVVFDAPVLAPERFAALKGYFETMLVALGSGERPEAMDVPHFVRPELLSWAFDPAILALVEPIVGSDIALFSSHFICKPGGHGKRVPWHEDSAYWRGLIEPMEVCTVWLSIDRSTRENGCMMVIPRTHAEGTRGYSAYESVQGEDAVFPTEIVKAGRNDAARVYIELEPNQASLHDARLQHGSETNTSDLRRCGWTLRYCSTGVTFNQERFDGGHQVYLAQGRDRGGNRYADAERSYPEVMQRRHELRRYRHAH